jgi:hypothetical protein
MEKGFALIFQMQLKIFLVNYNLDFKCAFKPLAAFTDLNIVAYSIAIRITVQKAN